MCPVLKRKGREGEREMHRRKGRVKISDMFAADLSRNGAVRHQEGCGVVGGITSCPG